MKIALKNITGDWIANVGVISSILLILALNFKEDGFVYSIFSLIDSLNSTVQIILAIIMFLTPIIFTLISVLEISKEKNFSRFNWSFWIMMALCISYGMRDAIDYYTYVLFIIAYLLNFYQIKNIVKTLSYTFGQIPFVLISFLFIGTLINLFKKSFK